MSRQRPAADVDSPLDPEQLSSGTSVLVAGPAMTGKRQLLFDLLGGTEDTASILVTTKRDGTQFERAFQRSRDREDWDVRLVDCVSRSHSMRRVRDTDTRKHVGSAGDLTGIGIAVSGFMREFYHDDREARFGLHTLSTLLMYADLKRVFQFCHVMNGRITSSGFEGIYTLDTTERNAEALDMLMGVFDALVEVREGEDRPELRVRGGEFGPRRWTEF